MRTVVLLFIFHTDSLDAACYRLDGWIMSRS